MARPKRVFTDEEEAHITEMALNNCHFETIAMALEIPITTLKRRFGRFIIQKRAEGRAKLRQRQVNLSKSQAAMAIFLGKNELNQTDKQTISNETQQKPLELTQDELKELKKLAGHVCGIKYRTSDNVPETPEAKKIVLGKVMKEAGAG